MPSVPGMVTSHELVPSDYGIWRWRWCVVKSAVEIGLAETFLGKTSKILHGLSDIMRFTHHFGFRMDLGDGGLLPGSGCNRDDALNGAGCMVDLIGTSRPLTLPYPLTAAPAALMMPSCA
ncbi:MAG: hypothetical protein ACLUB5_04030 [Bifidobacterium dentium]